jgi:Type II secretion system (T2SS), protein M subtype b
VSALRARLQALFGGLQRWYAGHSRRDQRIVLGVLALAGFSVVYLWAWVPLRVYRQTVADEIVEGQEQLARASRTLGSADSLKVERETLEKKLKQARERLLPGRGGTLGAAALQERTNSLAAEKGITVQSTQVMKEEALDPYRKVSVRLTLSGELKPFAELVSGLEYGQQLSVPIVEVNRRGAVPGAKGPRTLSATIEVAGFVLSEEAKADEAPAAEPVEAAGEVATVEGADAAKAAEGAGAPTGAPPPGAPSGPPAGAPVPPPGAPSGAGAPPIPAVAPGTPTSTTVVPSGTPGVTTTTARGPAPAGAPARPRTTGTTGSTAPLPFAPKVPPTSVPVPEKGDQG